MIKPNDFERARILIVDDCPDSADLLAELLAAKGYYCVHRTVDAAVVCDLHAVNDYDLILLDLHMPFISGLKIMEQMRKLVPDSYLPVIVLTGDDNLRLPALEAGAYDFIAKPFDITDLTVRVHNMLEVRLLHKFSQEQRRLQQHTELRDPLTGLPSRRLAMDRIAVATERAKRHLSMTIVMCLGIDGLKLAREQKGDDYGNELLKQFATQLSHRVRKEDTVARIGEAEFLLVLSDIRDPASAVRPAQAILDECSTAMSVGATTLALKTSIGIAICPLDADEPEDLVQRAAEALNAAHRAGKSQYRFASATSVSSA
jgi:two-component system cell cycle response regulator